MNAQLTVFPTEAALGAHLAAEIADGMERAAAEGRRYLLGCPGGRSPRSTYQALTALVRERGLDLSHVVIAMMDEYVVPATGGTGYADVPHDAHYSCHRFAREEIAGPLGIPGSRVWFPEASAPHLYDQRIADAGGIDLFVLASGATDGHIAFNPPGSPLDSVTRVTALAEETRRDNMGTFPGFTSLSEVPLHGVTVGVATILRSSRALRMVITGAHKRTAVRRVLVDTFDPAWPASLLAEGGNAALYADAAAAAG
ncbi:6-phosphogluconolactonase [Streptomyces iconiensis]|uniref:6-phosphogluconolactonase n=1 Tax=Streptomyces iconiensis TaxID=1384038 RepID=A0ABT7A7Q8_9ACTN|nr:6-phosphogluconolactonase [Streptomyces iconiensis]MDJ1137370.1 6-phosphogluconolactonase [Streptomyces iconiensis]